MVYHRILNTVPCAIYSRTLLFIPSIYSSLHLLTLTSHSISPPPPSPLATTSLFSSKRIFFNSKVFKKKFKTRKHNPENGRKCLRIVYLIRYLYVECIDNSYNLKNNLAFKRAKDLSKHFSKKIYKWPVSAWKDAQHHCHQRNANQNHSEIPLHTH